MNKYRDHIDGKLNARETIELARERFAMDFCEAFDSPEAAMLVCVKLNPDNLKTIVNACYPPITLHRRSAGENGKPREVDRIFARALLIIASGYSIKNHEDIKTLEKIAGTTSKELLSFDR
jgi:hypothetical protein